MTAPVIGITTGYQAEKRPTFSLPGDYVETVLLAGGVPLLLPAVEDARMTERLLAQVDGVLLSGGPDVDPTEYGEGPHPKTRPLHPRRNRFDLSLARLAACRGLPVMGICLGCQVLNVALGGTLYQHVPDEIASALRHSAGEPGQRTDHRIRIAGDSHLARIVGTTDLATNSSHHQAIREVAPPLRPVAWTESSRRPRRRTSVSFWPSSGTRRTWPPRGPSTSRCLRPWWRRPGARGAEFPCSATSAGVGSDEELMGE